MERATIELWSMTYDGYSNFLGYIESNLALRKFSNGKTAEIKCFFKGSSDIFLTDYLWQNDTIQNKFSSVF